MTRSPLVPIALILIATGIFFLYVRPTYNGSVAAMQAQIAGYDDALTAAAAYSAKANELAAARNSIPPENLKRLETFLPDGADNVQIILDLDALAARSGLSLADFTTSAPRAEDANAPTGNQIEPVDLTVTATGTYGALRTFMAGVEKSLRLIDIMNLTVKQADSGVYTYQLGLRFYSLH
ncbi:MAG: type 4a pilus biogenesis protein PilO [bacterium]